MTRNIQPIILFTREIITHYSIFNSFASSSLLGIFCSSHLHPGWGLGERTIRYSGVLFLRHLQLQCWTTLLMLLVVQYRRNPVVLVDLDRNIVFAYTHSMRGEVVSKKMKWRACMSQNTEVLLSLPA